MIPFRPTLGALALLCAATAADASTYCRVQADFDLRVERDAIELQREGGTPATLRLADGRLWIDGEEQRLAAADRRRIRDIEAETRALLPEVRELALASVGLAVEAVGQVAGLLDAGAAADARKRAAALGEQLGARIDAGFADGEWDDSRLEQEVEALVEELAPQIAAEFAAVAVKAALSGDEAAARAIEQRAEAFGKDLEQAMKARAKAIEARAQGLCPRIERIDALEDALDLRLADGGRIDLLRR